VWELGSTLGIWQCPNTRPDLLVWSAQHGVDAVELLQLL